VEGKLQKSMKNEGLIELLNFHKSLVYFATSLRANEIMMEKLQEPEMLKICADDRGLLGDAITENRQAIEMADIYSNVLSGITDAFASIISNNLSMVMKFLTSVTIILMLPTLLASIYGMNIKLPLQNWPHAFTLTMGISAILSIVGVIVFVWRKWF
jgi:magnesium transporter